MIPKTIAARFPEAIRSRGRAYYADGLVVLNTVQPGRVTANVRGTQVYDVAIRMNGSRTDFECDCPYAEDNWICKHVWATLLAADAEGAFDSRAPSSTRNGSGGASAAGGHVLPGAKPAAPDPPWKKWMQELRRTVNTVRGAEVDDEDESDRSGGLQQPLEYLLGLDVLRTTGEATLAVRRDRRYSRFSDAQWLASPDEADREIAHRLLGTRATAAGYGEPSRRFLISPLMYGSTLRMICETGRCRFASQETKQLDGAAVRWLGPDRWQPRFAIVPAPDGAGWRLRGWLRNRVHNAALTGARNDAPVDAPVDALTGMVERALEDVVLVTQRGLLVTADGVGEITIGNAWPLLYTLRRSGPIEVSDDDLFELTASLMMLPDAPPIELPQSAAIEHVEVEPVPHLHIGKPQRFSWDDSLPAKLSFSYGGTIVQLNAAGGAIVDRERRRIVRRMPQHEQAARARLIDAGAKEQYGRSGSRQLAIPPRRLERLVLDLVAEGWHVEADGRVYRSPTHTEARVTSGIDWFELDGGATFGNQHASLAALLAALQRGDRAVMLDDGSFGILPAEWLQRYAAIAGLASGNGANGNAAENGGPIRFHRSQAGLLDALLADQPDVDIDAAFTRIRAELRTFERITPIEAPRGFRGELRQYQKEGLGWMAFLRKLGLGGCLADDMGLGKTVQVLALLQQRRLQRAGPSLVVVPKSLVFNWLREAERFAPRLRVRDYTGGARRREPLDPDDFDLLVSTYGTLRRDAPDLRRIEFDYVILDEAQAIKNAATASSRAARLLHGRHRLALSGTPIENSLAELWSLFEFLNPGMLGASDAFTALRSSSANGTPDAGERAVLARAVRPFLLRRTKDQVAPELPPRTEQTLVVELEGDQRRLYNDLRDHYRRTLLGHVDAVGIRRSRIQILEALLRLRQAACHPALVDKRRTDGASAKLDVLMDTLRDVVAEGHRTLVFSQFTSFLALVRGRLESDGIAYEYLDGRTRDRQARVQRFQNDASIPVFLISLRAGGHGLNLTAADYVFVLDPWWNPAVEAQAIDRTHRIGQDRPVIALRLIARDTVEEKVLELQQRKRELADAILGADASLISRITREDLQLLLD
jgi:superfamily II DNA or RNA helicase